MDREFGHDDVVDITLRFGNLSVSVSGPSSQTSQLVSGSLRHHRCLDLLRAIPREGHQQDLRHPQTLQLSVRPELKLRPRSLFALNAFWILLLLWAAALLTGAVESSELGLLEIGQRPSCKDEQALRTGLPSCLFSPKFTWFCEQTACRDQLASGVPGLTGLPWEELTDPQSHTHSSPRRRLGFIVRRQDLIYQRSNNERRHGGTRLGRFGPFDPRETRLCARVEISRRGGWPRRSTCNCRYEETRRVSIGTSCGSFAGRRSGGWHRSSWWLRFQEFCTRMVKRVPLQQQASDQDVPSRTRATRRNTGRGKAMPSGEQPKAKRPTAASLHASLQQVLQTLPGLSNQMQQLMDRQAV